MVILRGPTHWLPIFYKTKRSFGGNSSFALLMTRPFFLILRSTGKQEKRMVTMSLDLRDDGILPAWL